MKTLCLFYKTPRIKHFSKKNQFSNIVDFYFLYKTQARADWEIISSSNVYFRWINWSAKDSDENDSTAKYLILFTGIMMHYSDSLWQKASVSRGNSGSSRLKCFYCDSTFSRTFSLKKIAIKHLCCVLMFFCPTSLN